MASNRQITLLAAAVTLALPGGAHAQTASSSSGDVGKLEEIVVTAERRTENLQRTAASVAVRTGDELALEGKTTLGQILEDVPGVSGFAAYGASGSGSDTPAAGITIRGIGSNVADPNTLATPVSAAAIYVDEVSGGIGGAYDIDRIEVLRGPQGTLYGRSATTGVLAIHTRNPELGKFGANVTAEAGNYNLKRFEGGVNLPAGDQFAVRVSGQIHRRDGYDAEKGGSFQAGGTAIDSNEGRIKLLYQPSESFSVLFGAAFQDNTTHTGERTGLLVAPQTINYSGTAPLGTGKDKSRQYWAQIDWDLGSMKLTYLPSYRTWTQDADTWVGNVEQPIFFRHNFADTPKDHFNIHELRLASDTDTALKWQTGLFYYDNTLRNSASQYSFTGTTSLTSLGTPALQYNADVNKQTTDKGVFGEATFAFTEALRLTGGLRYDKTEVKISEVYTSRTNQVAVVSGPAGIRDFKNTTYKLRLEYDVAPSNLLYASVSSGFLPGDLTVTQDLAGTPQPNLFDDESLTSYEVGSKNRFLDDSLQLNGSVYFYDFGGKQQSNINIAPATAPPGTTQFVTFSSPATVLGAELELGWLLTAADKVGLDIGISDARYHNKPALFAQYVADTKITGAPDKTANLSYDHTFNLGGDHSLLVGAEALYTSEYQYQTHAPGTLEPVSREAMRIPAKTTYNARASLKFLRQASVTAYVRNATDKRVKNNASTIVIPGALAFLPGGYMPADLTAPRTYGVVLNVSF